MGACEEESCWESQGLLNDSLLLLLSDQQGGAC